MAADIGDEPRRRPWSLRGRASRRTFWMVHLLVFGLALAATLLVRAIEDAGVGIGEDAAAGTTLIGVSVIVDLITSVICFWGSLVVTVRRWHDRNKSGWMILVSLIPIGGAVWTLVECGLLRGTEGPNRFGADPLNT